MVTVTELLTVARLVDNYEIYTGSGDTYWIDDQNFVATVPVGKRWFLIGGIYNIENSASTSVRVYNPADKIVFQLLSKGAATGMITFPPTTGADSNMQYGGFLPMDTGWYVKVYFSVAQSTAAYGTCVILEIDV